MEVNDLICVGKPIKVPFWIYSSWEVTTLNVFMLRNRFTFFLPVSFIKHPALTLRLEMGNWKHCTNVATLSWNVFFDVRI